jgi:predicted house-cleaning noncanonical NTP pyrophosphatase (MazG superfamily)
VKRYDKLVRDRIPEIIEANGERCTIRVLDEEEYAERLDAKLAEELAEYQASGELEELVDLVELVRAIVAQRGVSWEEFERKRMRKAEERGGFRARLLLESATKDQGQGALSS